MLKKRNVMNTYDVNIDEFIATEVGRVYGEVRTSMAESSGMASAFEEWKRAVSYSKKITQ